EFDYRHISGPDAVFPITLRILGNGTVFQWNSAAPPSFDWTHYRVAVSQDNFRRVSGTASFALALSNIQRVEISMQQTTSQEMNGIDNFTLIGDLSPGAPST